MQVATQGVVTVSEDQKSYDEVFGAAVAALAQAQMTIKQTDKESGFILAEKAANPLIANEKRLNINVTLARKPGATDLTVQSTLGGQLVAYGATKKIVEEFCQRFHILVPEATMTIDGKPYIP